MSKNPYIPLYSVYNLQYIFPPNYNIYTQFLQLKYKMIFPLQLKKITVKLITVNLDFKTTYFLYLLTL